MSEKLLDSSLILSVIFGHCTLNDLISFRQVSKSWKSIIDESLSSREELILFIETRPHQWYWSYERKPINLSNVINVKKTFYLDSEYLESTFKNIKRLLVVSSSRFVSNRDFNEFLNHFADLEHLQINYNPVKSRNVYHCDIKLDKLKTFYSDGDVKLHKLYCKNLVKLTLNGDFRISENSEFIETIEYLNVGSIYLYEEDICVFPKLKVLVLQSDYSIYKSFFPNLEELHILEYASINWFEERGFDVNKLFRGFFSKYERLDDVLKKYYDNLSDLSDIDLSIHDNLSFKYTDQLGKVIKHNKRIVQENGWRFKTVNFKTKFVKNENFLNLSYYFTCIQFISIDTDLTQEQLDLLPMFSPLVKKVTFSDNFKSCSKDDYKFLCKLGHLKVFYSDDSRCFKHIVEIIKNCEYFVRGESPSFIVRPQNLNNFFIKTYRTDAKTFFTTSEELLDHITKNYPDMLKN